MFYRWLSQKSSETRYLAEQVFELIESTLVGKGFGYVVGGANSLVLQNKSSENWPTVEFRFDNRGRPYFWIEFSILPPVCKRMEEHYLTEIPRVEANVREGVVSFSLIKKGRWYPNDGFGYPGLIYSVLFFRLFSMLHFKFFAHNFLDHEVNIARKRIVEMLNVFEGGIDHEWYTNPPESIGLHVIRTQSWAESEKLYSSAKDKSDY